MLSKLNAIPNSFHVFDYSFLITLYVVGILSIANVYVDLDHHWLLTVLVLLVGFFIPYFLGRVLCVKIATLSDERFDETVKHSMTLSGFTIFAVLPTLSLVSDNGLAQISSELLVGVGYAFLPFVCLLIFFLAFSYHSRVIFSWGVYGYLFFLGFYFYIFLILLLTVFKTIFI